MMPIGDIAALAFIGVASLSALMVVIGVVQRKIIRGGAPSEAVGQLTAEVESLRDELSRVNQHVEELAERQDFTERMLSQARERGQLPAPKDGGAS